ncbi:substrate-binding domain-containing protein [Catellatospora vulcania]|uniref:substrate-binding domain-containing protein n=1 Tax=Catellatospora vulcania TaxID=1460450 RepID=UPI0012D3B737|nr:substrate-binding domain-containing protein [Catellatospora vulcania]
MRYTVEERHERILELVRAAGTLRVTDLAEQLDISTVTLRRDVELLSTQGRLDRVRGSVSWPHGRTAAGGGAPAPGAGAVIGLVVPQATHYFADVIRGAQDAVSAAGGRLVLAVTNYQPQQDTLQAARLVEAGADGLLLVPSWLTGEDPGSADAFGPDVPTVLVERRGTPGTRAAELDRVCSDHASGAGLALRHLASLGHRQIALVSGISATQVQVRRGYDAALAALGLTAPHEPLELYAGDVVPERIEAAADALAAAVAERRISAALVVGDVDALMIVQSLRARGLRVPEDLALVAYDDDVAALSDLPLTAVAPPKHAVGEAAVRLLLQRLDADGKGVPRQHLELLPELRLRVSCGRLLPR